MTHGIAYYEEVISKQAQIINFERARRRQLEEIISNKKLPINMRQATFAVKHLVDTSTPDEEGWYRAHLPKLADTAGSSASTMSRAVRNFAECTGAIEIRKVPDKNDPFKEIVYIKPTEILDRPAEIEPIKDIKRHGGLRVARCNGCGSENIVERKYQVCGDCGEIYKAFEDRPVNTPLQDATRESESELSGNDYQIDESDALQDATYTVDTQVSIARCNALDELKSLPQWVVWKYEQKQGKAKPDKVPYNVHRAADNARADVSNPATWSTYQEAKALYEKSQRWHTPYAGVGFVFKRGGGIVGIDYDNSLQVRINSYSEISVSGNGVHSYVHGSIPKGTRRNGIEMYDSGRFFTWTGNHLAGTPETIEDKQAELDALYKELAPETTQPAAAPLDFRNETKIQSDEEILDNARNGKNGSGAKFSALYDGNWSGYHSQSEADLALFESLLYWTDGNVSTSRRLFEKSGLMRPKWERDDYRERTINRALAMWQRRERRAS